MKSFRVQILRFSMVGAIGFVINAGIVEWLTRFFGPIWPQILAFPIAVSVTWWFNRHYTFDVSFQVWHKELLRYTAANALGWLVTNFVYFFFYLTISANVPSPGTCLGYRSSSGCRL